MGSYRRSSRLIFGLFSGYSSKISEPRNMFTQQGANSFNSFSKITQISQPIFRNPVLYGQNQWIGTPFLGGAKRFYYADKRNVDHFTRWYQNPRNKLIAVLVVSGVAITVYFGNLETVPYTKRTHFVIFSDDFEKRMEEKEFNEMKNQFKGKILPPLHPQSIRVRNIAQDIIDALERGLSKEQVKGDIRYSEDSASLPFEASHASKTAMALSDDKQDEWIGDDKWREEEEILDNKCVQQSRQKGQEKGVASKTSQLEGWEWEVIVVDEPIVNALCFPGGKIVVFAGLLEHFDADAEVATIVGHEVAHAVARHTAEETSLVILFLPWLLVVLLAFPWLAMLLPIPYLLVSLSPDIVKKVFKKRLTRAVFERMEMEADCIGLMLIASAGYDPRVAPQVCEKFGKVVGDSAWQEYLSTHPLWRKRAQVLARAKVMEEAVDMYREVQHTGKKGVGGFL